jgi:NADPH:quinone reductase-like Zn-dependent oxidoreductase
MKAVQYERFGGPEVLRYLDLPDPRPGQGELLIKTAAIGVNFPDIRERLGVYNKAETRVGGVQLPQVGGIAFAGTVVEAGPDTTGGLVGRRVVALMKKGAYAELAVAAEALCAAVDTTPTSSCSPGSQPRLRAPICCSRPRPPCEPVSHCWCTAPPVGSAAWQYRSARRLAHRR